MAMPSSPSPSPPIGPSGKILVSDYFVDVLALLHVCIDSSVNLLIHKMYHII